MNRLPEGKIDHEILKELVKLKGIESSSVIQYPSVGVDVAAIDLAEIVKRTNKLYNTSSIPYLIYKSDPITFPTPEPGKYLIAVNRNDLATAGAIPFGITITLLFPKESTKDDVINIQNQLHKTAVKENILILGGHTEITSSVNNPVLSASMIGFVPPEYYIPSNPQPGDVIICSGYIGAEGTGILVSEGKDKFQKVLTTEEVDHGEFIGKNIDISTRIIECNKSFHEYIHCVHDATEGGILAAIYESIEPLGLGAEIEYSDIPISQVTKKIAKFLQIDPYRLISSGCVLLYVDVDKKDKILNNLNSKDFPAKEIGRVTSKSEIFINRAIMDPPSSDEIIRGLKKLNLIMKD